MHTLPASGWPGGCSMKPAEWRPQSDSRLKSGFFTLFFKKLTHTGSSTPDYRSGPPWSSPCTLDILLPCLYRKRGCILRERGHRRCPCTQHRADRLLGETSWKAFQDDSFHNIAPSSCSRQFTSLPFPSLALPLHYMTFYSADTFIQSDVQSSANQGHIRHTICRK